MDNESVNLGANYGDRMFAPIELSNEDEEAISTLLNNDEPVQEVVYDWEKCYCYELGYQICSHYELWCEEQQQEMWWNSLTEEEKASWSVTICYECCKAFTDNPGEQLCMRCSNLSPEDFNDGVFF